eukprot:sb/3466626/
MIPLCAILWLTSIKSYTNVAEAFHGQTSAPNKAAIVPTALTNQATNHTYAVVEFDPTIKKESSNHTIYTIYDYVEKGSSNAYFSPYMSNCTTIEVNGYLHEQCEVNRGRKLWKCPRSDELYTVQINSSDVYYSLCDKFEVTSRCQDDPGVYQVCGHDGCSGSRVLNGTTLLCGTFMCEKGSDFISGNYYEKHYARCDNYTRCEKNLNMVNCTELSRGNNDSTVCDESYCNDVEYGMWCGDEWVSPYDICDGESDFDCPNREDEVGCYNWTTADHTTCIQTWSGQRIKIQQSMRCIISFYKQNSCSNGQDQTNCSDPYRVAVLTDSLPMGCL